MSITRALLITIPTSDISDPQPALNIKSNVDGSILLDVLVDTKRFAVDLNDMQQALAEIREFNVGNVDEGHSFMHISNVDDIPELEIMSLDNIPEKKLDEELPF